MKFKKILDQVQPTDILEDMLLMDSLFLSKIMGKKMASYVNLTLQQKNWLDDNGFKHSYNKNLGEHEILIEEYP